MKTLKILLLLGFILRLVLSVQIYSGDVNNHIAWGKDGKEFGFQGIYEREFFSRYGTLAPTYPPIPIFLFNWFFELYDWTYKVSWDLNLKYGLFPSNFIFFLEDQDTLPAFLKIPAILADLGIAYLVFLFAGKLTKNKRLPLVLSFLVLFNPAFFYNSAYWGQIEAVPLFFVLSSFYLLLFSKRHILSAVLFSLALLTKQTSIVFSPIYAVVFFYKYGFKESAKGFLVSLSTFWFLFLPFFKEGSLLAFPFSTYLNKIQTGSGSDFVTDHAFNFWGLVSGLGKISDSEAFWLGLPYKLWGYAFFGVLLSVILYYLYKSKFAANKVIFAAALIPFAAFLFLTRMHERYLEQALPFLLLVGVEKRSVFWIFIIVSVFHLANLYHNWWAPRIDILVNFLSWGAVINGLILFAIGSFSFLLIQYIKENR